MNACLLSILALASCVIPHESALASDAAPNEKIFRLYEGITAYINNPEGRDFDISLDLRDLNLFANGPREVLIKIYDPDGKLLARQIVPDDGVRSPNFSDRIGGWDHELQYYANLYAKGTNPSFRWSAWSDPARLETLKARTFNYTIKGGKKGAYRLVIAGTGDNYVTLRLNPDLPYAVCGHPNFLHAHGNMLGKAYIYVPKGTTGLFLALVEPDLPRTRHFKLTGPDGKVLFDGAAPGGYIEPGGADWKTATLGFAKPGAYDGQLLTLEVSDGPGDYLIKLTLQQPKEIAVGDRNGMGSTALFAPDPKTAMALRGGTIEKDGEVFWHPFQVRFHDWLKNHPLDGNDREKALRTELETIYNGMRLIETSDGRGTPSWINWAYVFGYYGCKIWRPSWLVMSRDDMPEDVREIIREGLIMGGDRLAFAVGGERVNGNAFAQINVALWYCQRASGDAMQKERFETFWNRWKTEGWGAGAGLSRSGDAQEHFAHDMHYGSYLLDNWRGVTWVKNSILEDAKDDTRFQEVVDRYRELYTYLYCADANGKPVSANPWSARTQQSSHLETKNWELDGHQWKGKPGPDFTVSVNGGDEWFAARRKGYYVLTFHGRLAPEWMSRCFEGQLGFGGGAVCQLTVPGKGPVLASTLNGAYGQGMDPSNWRNFHIHSIVGERWDGFPIVSGISEPAAHLHGNTVVSDGEVRNGHVKIHRSYAYQPDGIDCEARMAESDYAAVLSIWSHDRHWSEMKEAYEMLPFMPDAKVTLFDGAGKELGVLDKNLTEAKRIHIDRGGFGVDVVLEKPMQVKLGDNHTALILLTDPNKDLTPADQIGVKYRLVPFGA